MRGKEAAQKRNGWSIQLYAVTSFLLVVSMFIWDWCVQQQQPFSELPWKSGIGWALATFALLEGMVQLRKLLDLVADWVKGDV